MNQRDDKLRNLVLLGSIFALVGLGLSFYSLFHHIELKAVGHTSFSCNINEALSCDDIANSKFAEDPWGNPMGVYGIGYFLGLLILLITSRVKETLQRDTLQAYSALVVIGALVSITLFCISEFIIGKICPTCVGIYLITFAQLAVWFFSREAIPRPWSISGITNGAWYSVVALLAAIAVYQGVKPRAPSNMTLDNPKAGEELADLRKQIVDASKSAPGPLALLDAVVSPAVKIDLTAYSGLGEDFHRGSAEAKVKIVEFADYQCPACGNAAKTMRQIHQEFGDKVLIVFKNYPLDNSCNPSINTKMHQFACQAARYSRCAGANGKFWDMNEHMYENQKAIDATSLVAWVKTVGGLSDQQVKECDQSKDVLAKIQDDVKQANEAGLQGTPTLFFNGQKYNGNVDVESIRSIIQALLAS
ncbi:MAG: thioredoxin domain-containing protein [Chitinophagaceae bacterium]|nr:thioredoxin domain-containing protein [Oligoflexus sp.]